MAKVSLRNKAIIIARPIVEQLGYELVDIEYKNPGGPWRLVVYIYKESGIDFKDCELVSKTLDPIFDKDESIIDRYDYLQVSSPGLDRHIKSDADLMRSIGKELEISLFAVVNDNKNFNGILLSFDDENIVIDNKTQEIKIGRKNIAKAVLYIEF